MKRFFSITRRAAHGFISGPACLGAALIIAFGSAAWADALVLEDMVGTPSYHRGQRLPGGSTVIIPEGSTLYIIDDNLNLQSWDGTRTVPLAIGGEKSDWFDQLIKMLRPKGYSETASLQRRGGTEESAPTPDLIDPFLGSTSGTELSVCVDLSQPVRLWNGGRSAGFAFTLARSGHKAEVKGTWPVGPSSIAWPASLPIETGTVYRLNVSGQATDQTFRLIATPAVSRPALPQAEELARLGCRDQAFVMLRWLADHPTP